MPDNYFTDLLSVECATDRKGKLTYVSWIEAWAQLKQRHPGASYEVHRTDDGRFLHGEGFVMCSVTVPDAQLATDEPAVFADVTHTMWLPVMDGRNQQIEDPSTTQINKAVMRCLAKAVAMHGLGAYVYMGEDLPTVEAPVDYAAKFAAFEAWAQTAEADDLGPAERKVRGWPAPWSGRASDVIAARRAALGAEGA